MMIFTLSLGCILHRFLWDAGSDTEFKEIERDGVPEDGIGVANQSAQSLNPDYADMRSTK